jgi:activator of Hsp90 ATPase-like protein
MGGTDRAGYAPKENTMSVDTPASDRELVLTRLIDAPREKLFRAWTEPEVLKRWFTPVPYTTPVVPSWTCGPAAPT